MAVDQFTVNEMNILATAVANLVNTTRLCKVSVDLYQKEKTKYRILCSDGVWRRVRQKNIVEMMEKIVRLSGHELNDDAKAILREAGVQ